MGPQHADVGVENVMMSPSHGSGLAMVMRLKLDAGTPCSICMLYKDRAAPPIGGPALHHSGVKTVQRREREGHDSYQEVEVNIYTSKYMCM